MRYDGAEAHAGEAGSSENSPGAEEDDLGGGGRSLARHYRLHRLPDDDAGQEERHTQAVSVHCVLLDTY